MFLFQIENYAEALENEVIRVVIDLGIAHEAVAGDLAHGADVVDRVHLAELEVLVKIVRAVVRSPCIGMYLHLALSISLRCNIKQCRQQGKFQPIL